MSDIILHHYEMSPFARKIRVLLGLKNIRWRSVEIPRIMPKPDVVALTGGYRRTPILQVGADVYCDTALIARQLDRLAPEPALYPPQKAGVANALAQWADSTLFQNAVALAFQKEVMMETFAGDVEKMKSFAADRAAMSKDAPRRRITAEEAGVFINTFLHELEAQFDANGPYLLGPEPTIADAAVYHPLWFIQTKPIISERFADFPKVNEWMQRVDGWGEGEAQPLDSGEALKVANTLPAESLPAESMLENFQVGDEIEVTPGDYAFDPVVGRLVYCDHHQVVLSRYDERAGNVVVHFPRVNYDIGAPRAEGN